MAESLWEWSRTAATNASADGGINWAEGMSPAAINNSARGMMAAIAKYLYDQSGQIVTAGTSTVYTATTTSGLGSLAEGRMLCVEMDETCGATPTMNVDGLGAKKLYRYASTGVVQIAANELRAGGRYILQYDTSLDAAAGGWVVLNASVVASVASTAVTFTADDRILGRVSGAGGAGEELTVTQVLDLVDSTRGTVLYRGASVWEGLDPGTAGRFLRDPGTGANPTYQSIGRDLIASGVATSVATVDLTLGSTYKVFDLEFDGYYPVTDGQGILLRVSDDNGATYENTNYAWQYVYNASSGTGTPLGSNSTTAGLTSGWLIVGAMSNSTTLYNNVTRVRITIPQASLTYTTFSFGSAYVSNGHDLINMWGAGHAAYTATNLRLLYQSGNIARMNYRLYGVST
jgi:hypothetical protein